MVHNKSRAQTQKSNFVVARPCIVLETVPWDRAQHTNKCGPQKKELRVQLRDWRRQAFLAVSDDRTTARQCRGYGPYPSGTAAGDTNIDSKLQPQHPFPSGNKFSRTNFQRCCRNCTGVHERVPCYHAHHTRRTTKEWASSAASQTEVGSMDRAPCEEYRQTGVHSSTSTRWPCNEGEPWAEFWTTCATRRTFV